MSFDSVPEQDEAKRLLRSALAEGPAHAYLFHGPAGVGKRAAQQELDLRVRTAQIVRGPLGQRVVYRGVQPQQHALAFGHHRSLRARP